MKENYVMATYKEIQSYIKKKYGYVAQTCWIDHTKKLCGLNVSMAPNRADPNNRVKPCPENKISDIKEALKYFNMI